MRVRKYVRLASACLFAAVLACLAALLLSESGTVGRFVAAPLSPLLDDNGSADPWDQAQIVLPQDLATQLSGPAESRPLVVCVGFDFLYQSAHVRGAVFYGPAREAGGLKALEDAAKAWSPNRDVVIYCGCCPMKQCPNLRPAFVSLKRMGFTHLRVLDLAHDFRQDWLEKGLPTEKAPSNGK